MKAVLISIRPEWVRKILNGSKTVEIRKTVPNEAQEALGVKPKPITRPPQSWRYVVEV